MALTMFESLHKNISSLSLSNGSLALPEPSMIPVSVSMRSSMTVSLPVSDITAMSKTCGYNVL